MHRLTPIAVLISIVTTFPPSVSNAQLPVASAQRFEIAFAYGRALGGPATRVLNGLRQIGYVDTEICPFDCGSSSGRTQADVAYSLTATARYMRTTRWGVALDVGQSKQTIRGTREIRPFEYDQMLVATRVRMVSPTVIVANDRLSWQVGPAAYQIQSPRSSPQSRGPYNRSTKIGLMTGARLTVPMGDHFAFNVSGQFRLTGSAAIGPTTSSAGTLPAINASFNQLHLGAGLGLRF